MTKTYGRRSKLEIDIEVLSTINTGESLPTRIMYKCNLSWKLLKETLSKLVSKDFILMKEYPKAKRTKRSYYITDKGLNVIKAFDAMKPLIN